MEPIQGLENLTIPVILERLKQVPMEGRTAESLYLPGYEMMLEYFSGRSLAYDGPKDREFKAQLVGSWLPRCFRTHGNTPGDLVFREHSLSNLLTIVDWMGGSLAGMSKMLHFDDPTRYPIYDRVVAASIDDRMITYDVEGFLNFTATLQRILEELYHYDSLTDVDNDLRRAFNEIRKIVSLGKEEPTGMRTLELALYLIGMEIEKR